LIDRRDFLGSALLGAAAAALGPAGVAPATAAEARDAALAASPLPGGLTLITGAGANVVAARGPEGAVLVDGGAQSRSRDLIKTALQAAGAGKVQALFNTHWHPEQTGSNETLGRDGVRKLGAGQHFRAAVLGDHDCTHGLLHSQLLAGVRGAGSSGTLGFSRSCRCRRWAVASLAGAQR